MPAILRWLPPSERKVGWALKLRRFVHGAEAPTDLAHYAWKEWLTEHMKHAIYGPALRGLKFEPTSECFRRYLVQYRGRDSLNAAIYTDTKLHLSDDILVKVDRMSMANSLEVRGPLLDYRVVEFMARIPGHVKMPGFRLKHFLKETLCGLLPAEVLREKKSGFNVPMARWLRHALRILMEERLNEAEIERQGFFDPAAIRRLLTEHIAGAEDWSRQLWSLLLFSFWQERYGRATP